MEINRALRPQHPLTAPPRRKQQRKRGIAVVTLLMLMTFLLILGGALLSLTTSQGRLARQDETREVTNAAADAGAQRLLLALWSPFNTTQKFTTGDTAYNNAASNAVKGLMSGALSGTSGDPAASYRYCAYVTGWRTLDPYTRDVTIEAIGWVDTNGSGGNTPDAGEPFTHIQQHVRLGLVRARVFDYTYFINNHGWMTGFNTTALMVNGDMRANGDFNIDGGTINGQVIAEANPNVQNAAGTGWGATGLASVSGTVSLADDVYNATMGLATGGRARQAYNAATMGSKTSTTFASWKDIIYDNTPDANVAVDSDISMYGQFIADVGGVRNFSTGTQLLPDPVQELPMPDLSDITHYRNDISAVYTDDKATFKDGTANPDYGAVAYIDVWDSTKNKYQRVTGQNGDPPGVVSGSVLMVGTAAHPIKVHGPVTVINDVGIKGVVAGQGTLYTGRNVSVLGDLTYAAPPKFDGSGPHGNTPSGIDQDTDQKSLLALCARGSVMIGDTTTFGNDPLDYMRPPFTRSRRDNQGNIIPAYDATASDTGYTTLDGTTPKKYQSLLKAADIAAVVSPVTQIDAIMYTNQCVGGKPGDGTAKGFTINGSVISKDEAMSVNLGGGGRMTLNYDTRVKERSGVNNAQATPLIDINLPRNPQLEQLSWITILSGFPTQGGGGGNGNGNNGNGNGNGNGNNGNGNGN